MQISTWTTTPDSLHADTTIDLPFREVDVVTYDFAGNELVRGHRRLAMIRPRNGALCAVDMTVPYWGDGDTLSVDELISARFAFRADEWETYSDNHDEFTTYAPQDRFEIRYANEAEPFRYIRIGAMPNQEIQ